MSIDFGAPVPVAEMPQGTGKGGRASNAPALEAWLGQLTAAGTYELASKEEDGAHPVSRVTQLRTVAKEKAPMIRVETRAVTPGKRYRIFATVPTTETEPPAAKAGNATKK